MKKLTMILSFVLLIALNFASCESNQSNESSSNQNTDNQTNQDTGLDDKENENTGDDMTEKTYPPCVNIDGKVYKDTGYIHGMIKCGTYDGEIDSTVKISELPKKHNQSNFGVGYGYQVWGDDMVLVHIKEENSRDMHFYIFYDINKKLDSIPDGVCNITALVKEVDEENAKIKVSEIEIPEEYGYFEFPNDDEKALIEMPTDNYFDEDMTDKTVDITKLKDKKIRVYFDGDHKDFQKGYLNTVYRIEIVEEAN